MKKIIFFVLLIPILVFSQSSSDSILFEKNQLEIKKMNEKFIELEKEYEEQMKKHDKSLNHISTQIAAASYNVSLFSFVFAIAGLFITIYICWMEHKVVRIKDENKSLLEQAIAIKNEVIAVNELIQSDIYGLYLKIKREETINILNRLCTVPSDVLNVKSKLFSRVLKKEDFVMLKKAYIALENEENIDSEIFEEYKRSYFLLFFQHFLDLTVKDEVLNSEMNQKYQEAIKSANSNDILKSTKDFIKGTIDLGFQSKENQINEFLKCISNSKFKDFDQIYRIIYDSLISRDNKFKLYQLLEKTKNTRVARVKLGNLLISEFEETELTISEKGIIGEIHSIKTENDSKNKR